MNILFVSTTYPTPTRPQQGRFNHEMIRCLAQDHEIQVVTPIPWTQLSQHVAWRSKPTPSSLLGFNHANKSNTKYCSTTELDASDKIGQPRQSKVSVHYPVYIYPPKVGRTQYDRWYERSIRSTIAGILKVSRPDIVLSYWAHPDGAVGNQLAKALNCPSIIMVGGSDVRLLAKQRKRGPRIVKALSDASHVVAMSQELGRRLEELGLSKADFDVIYRGTNPAIFHARDREDSRRQLDISADRPLIVWAGRLEPVKNPDLFLDVAARVVQKTTRVPQFVMLGDGSLRRHLSRRLRRDPNLSTVMLLPTQTQECWADWLRAADVSLLTSRSEGIPNVLTESIACGTPFVASDVGGVAEIATPERDHLVASDSVEAFASATLGLLNQPHRPPAMFQPVSSAESASQLTAILQSCAAPLKSARHFSLKRESKVTSSFVDPPKRRSA